MIYLILYYFVMTLVDLTIVEFAFKPHWLTGGYLYEPFRWYYYGIWGILSVLFFIIFISIGQWKLILLLLVGGIMGFEDTLYWLLRAPVHWLVRRKPFMSDNMNHNMLPQWNIGSDTMGIRWFYIPEKLPWLTTIVGNIKNYWLLLLSYPSNHVTRRGVLISFIMYIIFVSCLKFWKFI